MESRRFRPEPAAASLGFPGRVWAAFGLAVLLTGCLTSLFDGSRTFDYDVRLLLRRADAQVLRSPQSDACVVATAAYQGRVMASAFSPEEPGLGWINRGLIRSGPKSAGEQAWGGEDWPVLGFPGGLSDAGPFELVRKSERAALFRRDFALTGRGGASSRFRLERRVSVLGDSAELNQALGSVIPVSVRTVGYRTESALANRGATAWSPEDGLISIGSRGRLSASSTLRVVVPFVRGSDAELGPVVATGSSGRPVIADGLVVFRGDGRGRFSLGARRATGVLGAWDSERELLTIVRFSGPSAPEGFTGEAIAVRGVADACEFAVVVSASSPDASLRRVTVHLTGPRRGLDVVARNVLGAGLDEIEAALP